MEASPRWSKVSRADKGTAPRSTASGNPTGKFLAGVCVFFAFVCGQVSLWMLVLKVAQGKPFSPAVFLAAIVLALFFHRASRLLASQEAATAKQLLEPGPPAQTTPLEGIAQLTESAVSAVVVRIRSGTASARSTTPIRPTAPTETAPVTPESVTVTTQTIEASVVQVGRHGWRPSE